MSAKSDIRRVVAARFLSRAGSEAAFFVGVWGKAAFVMGANPAQLAGIMFVVSASMIVGSIIAGVLIDRYGPRKVMIVAEVLFVPAALAVAAAQTLPQLAILCGLWAFFGAPVITAGASFAPFLATGEERLEKVNAWIEGAAALSFAVGPAVGALLVRYANVNWVFVLDAATSIVAAILISRVHLPPIVRGEETVRKHPLSAINAGAKIAYGMRSLRYYVLAGTLVWLAFGSFAALEPLFFRDVVGTGIEGMAWMNSIFGVGFIVGAALLPRLPRKIISARGLAIMVALTGVGTFLYVGTPDLRIIAFGAFVWSMVIGVMEPLLRTLLHRDTPPHALGRVMGTAEVHRRTGEIVPLGFAPALASAFGVQVVLIAGGLVATTVALLSWGEASAIDRENTLKGVADVEPERLRVSDEPISPNP